MSSLPGKVITNVKVEPRLMECAKAVVLDIQRCSTEDGPGLRTTVFFKGCNLLCAWCHNPESTLLKKQVQWMGTRCIGCRRCLDACANNGLQFNEEGLAIDRKKCVACASCVSACPTGAMEVKGTEWELYDLIREVLKDRAYFGKDGGVTVSGGEALMQGPFVERFLKELKSTGVHTAVDTAAFVPRSTIERILPYTDLVLLDLKLFDAAEHKKFTRMDNSLILENAKFLCDYIKINRRPELWIRTPIIPNATNTEENILAIGNFIRNDLRGTPSKWELCSFNNLCNDKYKRLNLKWDYANVPLLRKSEMERLYQVALKSGVDPDIVTWSGATMAES